MQHPPLDLPAPCVAALVGAAWGLAVAEITHLPVGFGSHHWRVTGADGVPWFVTADEPGDREGLAALEGALSVAVAARATGLRGAHAPVPSTAGALVAPLGKRYAVSVQPWLDGPAGRFGDRLDDADAVALVGVLSALHGIPAGRTGAVPEDSSVPGRAALEVVLDAVRDGRAPHDTGPLGPFVLDALRRRGPAVRRALDAADTTGHHAHGPAALVPTHGEPHPGNVVRTPEGPVLVDWETARLAEPERDLWLVAGRSDLDVAGLYAEQSGHPVDAGRLAARARRWALTDVADFVPTLLAAPEETPDTAWQVDALLGTLEEL